MKLSEVRLACGAKIVEQDGPLYFVSGWVVEKCQNWGISRRTESANGIGYSVSRDGVAPWSGPDRWYADQAKAYRKAADNAKKMANDIEEQALAYEKQAGGKP